MRRFTALVVIAGIATALPACETDKGEGLRAQEPCLSTPSPIAAPSFPSGFPDIADFTWTSSQSAGPSQIIQGYSGDALADIYKEMQDKFSSGGYSIAKRERDPHDAEVNFTSARNDGQVRLAEECQGRTSIVVTIRPKS